MTDLDTKERDLLERIRRSPELRTLFFRKVKGLRWFSALKAEGYFHVSHLPRPMPAAQEGYVQIPRWEVVEYLEKTSQDLSLPENESFTKQFVEILISATAHAKHEKFSNYQTWWKFAKVLANIPHKFVPLEIFQAIDYWFDDPYDRSLITDEVGATWLTKLLRAEDSHAEELALGTLKCLYKVVRTERQVGETTRVEANLRLNKYSATKVTEAIAELSGRRLGNRALEVFLVELAAAVQVENNDSWSSIWQPAIEDHEQNKYHDKAENILVKGSRDCLEGCFATRPRETAAVVTGMTASESQIVRRLAIHAITGHIEFFDAQIEILLDEDFFHARFRHETWQFLHRTYGRFSSSRKKLVIARIKSRERRSKDGTLLVEASAYEQALWLAAIKDFGELESELYRSAIETAKAEPNHPDFSSFSTSGFVESRSPFSVEKLASLEVAQLVQTLADFTEVGGWEAPSKEGLARTLKSVVKASPTRFVGELKSFRGLDAAYINALTEGFSELWAERASLPWDEIWSRVLEFIDVVIDEEEFWAPHQASKTSGLSANRDWVVSAFARLLEAGAKSDEHAFPEVLHEKVELIIASLLRRQPGHEFTEGSDAVSVAINSARGHCIEALINLTLRACRLADRRDKTHESTWNHFQSMYDSELARTDSFELPTLVSLYLSNFLYLSNEWTQNQLPKVFDISNPTRWRCAIRGYSYTSMVYEPIYRFLRNGGHFQRALEPGFGDEVVNKIVQNIVIAYVNGFEELENEDGLIRVLLNRRNAEELSQLIWFVWTLRKDHDLKLRDKVYQLWEQLSDALDLTSANDRKLASSLTQWSAYVDELDDQRLALLMKIAPFCDESYNSSELLVSLARLSEKEALKAHEVWLRILERSAPTYPEEAVRTLLANLLARGPAGRRAANAVVSEYLKRGDETPSAWLHELVALQTRSDLTPG